MDRPDGHIRVVRRVGLEPTSPLGQQSLSLPCMPIPAPPRATTIPRSADAHGNGTWVHLPIGRSASRHGGLLVEFYRPGRHHTAVCRGLSSSDGSGAPPAPAAVHRHPTDSLLGVVPSA